MPTFNDIASKWQSGIDIKLTDPEIIEALRKYAQDNNDQNGKALTKDEAVTEILYFFLIGSSK